MEVKKTFLVLTEYFRSQQRQEFAYVTNVNASTPWFRLGTGPKRKEKKTENPNLF